MATLIPAIGSCVSRMTSGEKRLAYRLEDKLEDDYLCWYDVSIGERTQHPDFVVFHPSRGLLVLEVKDCSDEGQDSTFAFSATGKSGGLPPKVALGLTKWHEQWDTQKHVLYVESEPTCSLQR